MGWRYGLDGLAWRWRNHKYICVRYELFNWYLPFILFSGIYSIELPPLPILSLLRPAHHLPDRPRSQLSPFANGQFGTHV
jgi:hypothetical protein